MAVKLIDEERDVGRYHSVFFSVSAEFNASVFVEGGGGT
jgi:hypothetical protein